MGSESSCIFVNQKLSKAVRLVRQLESARLASRTFTSFKREQTSGQQKSKVQFNAVSEVNKESNITELKMLMVQPT